jgi:lysophospholipase L1-like esterase
MGRSNLFDSPDDTAGTVAFVALGDSFTEGLNDARPDGTFRGWADRLAGMIAAAHPRARYANLAVRGKLLGQIVAEQVPAAVDLLSGGDQPGGVKLVTLAGGGNDILRPGADPDTLAELFDSAVARLRDAGCEVLVFTGFDPKAFPIMRLLRGRIAAYNMHLRAIADARDCYLVDMWSLRFLHHAPAWSTDRLHLTSQSHQRVALRACEVLGVPVTEDWRAQTVGAAPDREAPPAGALDEAGVGAITPVAVAPVTVPPNGPGRAAWLAARREDAQWAKEYFVPWINRRLRRTSSGDGISAKRPALEPVTPTVPM